VHVVGHGFASLVHLVSLNETALKGIVLFEFVVSCGFIVTQNGGNSEIFTTSIENNSCGLRRWRTNEDSTEINGIVLTVERNLELKIISVIL